MQILLDMNLSPEWEDYFNRNNIEAIHWSKLGIPKPEILKYLNMPEKIVL